MGKQPLYQKIVDDITSKIRSRDLKPGDQVPTELELSKQYDVSRITSKRALTELENQHLIERIQGKGSFVAESLPKESNVILFILPFPDNPGLGDYTLGISRYIEQTPYTIQIQPNAFLDKLDPKTILSQFAGFILYPEIGTSHLDILYSLYLERFPTVILDKKVEGIPFTSVTSDNTQGGYLATHYLIQHGHQRITFFSSQSNNVSSTIRDRYLGYLKAIHEAHLSFHSQEIEFDPHNYGPIIKQLKEKNVTGIVVENDIIAIYLMKELKKMGYQVPQDFSIIGFDNIQAASLIDPALTTISQNFEDIGYQAAQQLVHLIENTQSEGNTIVVPVELIARESTK
ncbi:DNA-binding LacI/PurR family transcriptional regulator [Pullulanibacillus pueri]|uniref:GntR family transcriptional regulator n=1 Tax=Pullulanibacillus pueri TaxID=1437324 RepID=A0A8J3ELV0_9BACL|nr:substrate-binding domain-containing protein [Pullulanibacillus pueri]MBM7682081.1 DNA-binding LacI/PurR family transcriptional regulator [Pullulanibacillus pueri]GGH80057.1 GntR family transcriptional regulator [Pullulanibacillus pueri]